MMQYSIESLRNRLSLNKSPCVIVLNESKLVYHKLHAQYEKSYFRLLSVWCLEYYKTRYFWG